MSSAKITANGLSPTAGFEHKTAWPRPKA